MLSTVFIVAAPPAHPQGAAAASPLAAYPGFGHNAAADEAQYRREQTSRDQSIARCMQSAGLRYTPVADVQRPLHRETGQSRTAAAPVDVNERYARSLSGAERTRYYVALYGVPNPNGESAGALWDPRSSSGGGCWGDALRAIPGVYAARSALAADYVALRRSIRDDPRVTAAQQSWGECMRARGFAYSSPRALAASRDSAAVMKRLGPEMQQKYELAAAASPACLTESQLVSVISAVRNEKESAFVLAHKAVLDQHLQRLRSQPGGGK
jgi:hypothetical protein